MTQLENPFASPLEDGGGVTAEGEELAEARRLRKEHLIHEALVKSVGTLFFVGSIVCFVSGVTGIVLLRSVTWGPRSHPFGIELIIGGCATLLGIAAASFVIAWGLRRFSSRVRRLLIVLSVLVALWFPWGTMIGTAVLCVLVCSQGRTVFSEQYRDAIRQTPEMRYKSSWLVVLFSALLLALVGVGIAVLV